MDSDHSLARMFHLVSIFAECWPLFGFDLWLEIFTKSPIETLCRLRSVCKLWNSVISSRFFINLHHSLTSSSIPPNLKPYFLVDSRPHAVKSYSLYGPQQTLAVHFPFRFRDSSLRFDYLRKLNFVNVVDGVVCVSYSVGSYFDSTFLWNPAIHKYVALPRIPFHLESALADFAHVHDFSFTARFYSHAIGFGRGTSSKNDFKVVRIWIPCFSIQADCDLPASYEVYSAEEGLWRVATPNINLKSCAFDIGKCRTCCFVNGTIHWIMSRLIDPDDRGSDRDIAVLMFDCEREEFRIMELPGEFNPMLMNVELLEYAGMLSVLLCRGSESRRVELWGMEEYGAISTWKKLYGFDLNGVDMIMNQPSFEERAPYGPKQWDEFGDIEERYHQILGAHVYEESMFLMDDTKAQSYGKEEIVHI